MLVKNHILLWSFAVLFRELVYPNISKRGLCKINSIVFHWSQNNTYILLVHIRHMVSLKTTGVSRDLQCYWTVGDPLEVDEELERLCTFFCSFCCVLNYQKLKLNYIFHTPKSILTSFGDKGKSSFAKLRLLFSFSPKQKKGAKMPSSSSSESEQVINLFFKCTYLSDS